VSEPEPEPAPEPETAPDPQPLTLPVLLRRGLTKRCPLCGQGHVFRGWFTIMERCPRCNFRLDERIEGHWLGSLGTNMIVSFVVLFVVMITGLVIVYPDFDRPWRLVSVTVTVAVLFPLAFFPVSKTLWGAIDLAMRPLEPDDDVDPRWIPPPVTRR
jgi:uncharacterized protein (DUF983 family)